MAPAITNPSSEDVRRIVSELRAAFEAHVTSEARAPGRWDLQWRLKQLHGLHRMFAEHAQEFQEAARKDIGRGPSEFFLESKGIEADLALLAQGLGTWMRPARASTPYWMLPSSSCVQSEPLGVVLVLGSWNYAAVLSVLPLAGALSAGNAVVVKPSEYAPAQAEVLARYLGEYLDPDAVRVVLGDAETGRRLVDDGAWDKVFYTGGGRAGAAIGASCAARLIPFVLELGGKSPTLVDETANLAIMARRVVQGCVGVLQRTTARRRTDPPP